MVWTFIKPLGNPRKSPSSKENDEVSPTWDVTSASANSSPGFFIPKSRNLQKDINLTKSPKFSLNGESSVPAIPTIPRGGSPTFDGGNETSGSLIAAMHYDQPIWDNIKLINPAYANQIPEIKSNCDLINDLKRTKSDGGSTPGSIISRKSTM